MDKENAFLKKARFPGPMFPIISIDGPAASGKSSVSREVARHLGIIFASSGELYRAVTWRALEVGVTAESQETLSAFLLQMRISSQERAGKVVFLVNDQDSTPYLSEERVNRAVSLFSRLPKFRRALLPALRDLGNHFSLVMEGRDIGSVVFPEIPYKFYLDASEAERQRRRGAQGIVDAIANRDQLDTTRKTAPLIVPPGAHVLDTTDLTLEEVVKKVLNLLQCSHFPASC